MNTQRISTTLTDVIATVVLGLALATFAAVNGDTPEREQELIGRVVATAQFGVQAAREGRTR